MKRFVLVLCCGLALGLSAPDALAYNILTLDMGGYWNNLADQYFGANPGYGTPGAQGVRWYTTVSPSVLQTVDLLDYDVFLVQSGFTDDYVLYEATAALSALSDKKDDIRDFVAAGHGLVAWTEPLPDGQTHAWDWTPVTIESSGVNHENLVEIADTGHPIVQGSTDASLSNWQSSWHGWFTSYDARLQTIVRTGDYGDGDNRTHQDLTLAGSYNQGGCGRMVFSMQDADYHAYQQAPGSDDAATFIRESLDWAAEPCHPIPEPATIVLMSLALLGGGVTFRRGRGGPGRSSSV